ncbi:hypothetical protein N7510_010852 [Penicillium lagena]|uniref:uncharacterized protein n=1 Tax=Penicillium lagena TaxID=94218 RepID=UPI002542694B|nr:uncharacterized protein N7510_010852 [Penicillium lagena]KAJ5601318.1 hypothetical protein N7510_010852 [Penicillium lagena]
MQATQSGKLGNNLETVLITSSTNYPASHWLPTHPPAVGGELQYPRVYLLAQLHHQCSQAVVVIVRFQALLACLLVRLNLFQGLLEMRIRREFVLKSISPILRIQISNMDLPAAHSTPWDQFRDLRMCRSHSGHTQ